MLRGHIPCTWDQRFVEELDYVYQEYTAAGDKPNQLKLVDPEDIHRYKVGLWMARDLPISEYSFITDNFRWLKNLHFQFNKLTPGMTGCLHKDRYEYYRKLYNVNEEDMVRVIVFMQDWKNGHYFEVDDVGITNWSAGDWVAWDLTKSTHLPANFGIEDRYTLMITGTKY